LFQLLGLHLRYVPLAAVPRWPRRSCGCSLPKPKPEKWANQVEVQRLGAAGILPHVRGDNEKAVALVRAAADLDATMDKHPATSSPVLPARELLADLLLELNQPAAALVEYRAMLSPIPIASAAFSAKQTRRSAAPRTRRGQVLSNELSPRVAERRPILVGWRTGRAR
jgi:hypothetical protein